MRFGRTLVLALEDKVAGFSLLEMSFVLIIMGVMLSVSLPFLSSTLVNEKNRQTDEVFRQIAHTLANHVLQTGRLPCAALPNASGEAMGEEVISPACLAQGVIPYRTLGISPSLARDGQGHLITYAVDPTFTQKRPLAPLQDTVPGGATENIFATPATASNYCEVESTSGLKVYDENDKIITDDPLRQPIFILVSHGKKGGFYLDTGGRRSIVNSSPLKSKNADNDANFVEASSSKDFDDKVFWKDRFSLLSVYGNFHCPPR